MKKLVLLSIFTSVLATLFSACSKEQRYTNKLDGTWDVTRIEIFSDDSSSSFSTDPDGQFTFESCKLKKEDYCPYTQKLSYTYGATTYTTNTSGVYRFTDDGNTLVLREWNDDGSYDETHYKVLDFSRKTLQVELNGDSRTVYTLERL